MLIEKAESVQSLTSAHLKESAEKFQKTESFHCYNRFQIAGYVQKMFDDFENDGANQKEKYTDFREYISKEYGLKLNSYLLNQYKEVYARLYDYQRFVAVKMTNEDMNTLFKHAKEIGVYLESDGEESKYWSDETGLGELFKYLKVDEALESE